MSIAERTTAQAVCPLDRLDPERGAAALVAGRQVALFRLPGDRVVALDHRDPATGANVLARGLLGTTAGGEWYVASPLLKHRYSLDDGRCLGEPSVSVAVHDVDVRDGVVHVILAPSS
jgi:nitrite reductase (NADH) small subunit